MTRSLLPDRRDGPADPLYTLIGSLQHVIRKSIPLSKTPDADRETGIRAVFAGTISCLDKMRQTGLSGEGD